ncbi:superoxide dismutase [uncultured Flavobacterium sp.]|uniref:superoxide dismutase n=1 Tax=uncultured Flavobacterium sp. TaxID=165435 RepID=UPI0030CA2238
MKKGILIYLLFISLIACKKDKQLIEVELPESNFIEEIKLTNPYGVKTSEGPFNMKKFAFQYSDLEPFIDAQTMEIHHSKLHLSYANKLNIAIKETEFKSRNIEDVLANLNNDDLYLKNNAGGYYNHNLFFEIISNEKNTKPTVEFQKAIDIDFGTFSNMKKQIIDNANDLYGSGWVWIIVDINGKLSIIKTINNENPLMKSTNERGIPIFALDLWEHAYYLQYNNLKGKYVENIFNIINWKTVSKKYDEATAIKYIDE